MPHTQDMIDTRAIEVATEALTIIKQHEKTCEQRWGHVAEKLGELNTNVRGLQARLWSGIVALVGLLLAVIGFLLAKHGI